MLSEEAKSFEEVLENNYTSEANDEEKIYIDAMIRRLKRVLNWELGGEQDIFDKETGPEIIRVIMTQFRRWKSSFATSNNLSDVIGLQHLIIYTMAKLCFYYWIRDTQMVADILRKVYLCDGHFSSMFAHVVNQNNRRTLWPAPSQEMSQKEHATILFFLTHAHNAKLQFSGQRFVDLRLRVPLRVPPVFLAAIYNKPCLLLLLLRHGANMDGRQIDGLSDDWDLNMLLRHLTRIMWASLGSDPQDSAWDSTVVSSTLYDVWECLRFLLRAIRQIQMGELEFLLMNFDSGGLTVTSSSHDFIRSISERGIVSKLVSRYLEPSELQHLSRHTIRDSLNQNWNLPYGIFILPLPKILQRYVDLAED